MIKSLTSVLLLALCATANATQPPQHVARAVDATLQLLSGERNDASLESFVTEHVSPTWGQETTEREILDEVRQVRDALPQSFDEVAVEAAPGGVVLLLGGAGERFEVELGIDTSGVTAIRRFGSAGTTQPDSDDSAAPDRRQAIDRHLEALETAHREPLKDLVADFEAERFSEAFLSETTREERRALLQKVSTASAAAGAAMIDEENGEFVLTLEGRDAAWRVHFAVLHEAPWRIDSLTVAEAQGDTLEFDAATLADFFDQLEKEGFSGVVHVARGGRILLEQAYGLANRELGHQTTLETAFGIGSTPIDFTVAGILLLAQRGALDLDAPLGRYLGSVASVPNDKRAMTLRHLITGASGLPDFHDIESDWDADLAWIDRDEAVRRILSQPLLFAPGTSRAHSHSAYGLAAAVLELVSGESYEEFLRRELFDPAGMNSTGMYGSTGGRSLRNFAVGYGASSVGLPNIPPNWGPTSWLVMGSGGMYSTLGDMLRFHRLLRSGNLLKGEFARRYLGERIGVGGSERGFYIFEALGEGDTLDNVALLIINGEGRRDEIRELSRALERFVLAQ